MASVDTEFETELNTEHPEPEEQVKAYPETNTEQTPDGAFRRQRNLFPSRPWSFWPTCAPWASP